MRRTVGELKAARQQTIEANMNAALTLLINQLYLGSWHETHKKYYDQVLQFPCRKQKQVWLKSLI